jgi:hypothetical protein
MSIPVDEGNSHLWAKVRVYEHPIPGPADLRRDFTKDDHVVQLAFESTLRSSIGGMVVVFPW